MENAEVTIETQNIQKEVERSLTVADFANLGKEVGELSVEIQDLENQFAVVKSEHKAKLEKLEKAKDKAISAINNGKTVETVECVMVKNFDTNTVTFTYNGDVVEERAMTEDERQKELFTGEVLPSDDEEEEEAQPSDIEDVIREEKKATKFLPESA